MERVWGGGKGCILRGNIRILTGVDIKTNLLHVCKERDDVTCLNFLRERSLRLERNENYSDSYSSLYHSLCMKRQTSKAICKGQFRSVTF